MGVDGHELSVGGRGLIQRTGHNSEGNHGRTQRAELLSPLDEHDVKKRQVGEQSVLQKGGKWQN